MSKFTEALRARFPSLWTLVHNAKYYVRKPFIIQQIHNLRLSTGSPAVAYLTEKFPARPPNRREYTHGGTVKMTYLAETFPHAYPSANILYSVSSAVNPLGPQIIYEAKKRGIKINVNQNGVAYPAWHGEGWEETNKKLKINLDQADFIIYQSNFCKFGAEHFLSPPNVPQEILYNPVDTRLFKPVPLSDKPRETTLILGGNQYERYRFELAVQAFGLAAKSMRDAKLLVTGQLWDSSRNTLEEASRYISNLGLRGKVVLTGTYAQEDLPKIFAGCHILLHTKSNDPCPTIVIEALAAGIPVVYLANGGTPELVGNGGIGVPANASWERIDLPDPHLMSEAVLKIMEGYPRYSQAARQRAVELFSLEKFIEAHRRIFETLVSS